MTSAPPPAPPGVDPPAWQPPPPPPPPAPAPRTQLRRSRNDKMIGGVAGGLAEYSGVDPLLWRVGFVALAFAGGSGVLVYLLLWLLMPAGTYVVAGYETPSSRPPRPPAGPRSPVPGVTIAGLLIVIGALVLITNTTAWDIGPRGFLGSALLVVGLGLVAAAFSTGRRAKGGLISVGIVLSLALVAATSVPWHGTGEGVGDRNFRPATVAQVREVYRGGVGDMTLDLSRLDQGISGGPVETRIEHGVGDIQVIVPRSADVEVRVDNGLGDVTLFGTSDNEGIFEGSGPQSWSGDGDPEFDIVINNGLGDVEVSRD
jgi:phage shock protein PspC (stress-responsive transcriptional regulator)